MSAAHETSNGATSKSVCVHELSCWHQCDPRFEHQRQLFDSIRAFTCTRAIVLDGFDCHTQIGRRVSCGGKLSVDFDVTIKCKWSARPNVLECALAGDFDSRHSPRACELLPFSTFEFRIYAAVGGWRALCLSSVACVHRCVCVCARSIVKCQCGVQLCEYANHLKRVSAILVSATLHQTSYILRVNTKIRLSFYFCKHCLFNRRDKLHNQLLKRIDNESKFVKIIRFSSIMFVIFGDN